MKYINIVENLNEIGQISLITFCTAKLHRYLRIKQHFLAFHQTEFSKILPLCFYYLHKSRPKLLVMAKKAKNLAICLAKDNPSVAFTPKLILKPRNILYLRHGLNHGM